MCDTSNTPQRFLTASCSSVMPLILYGHIKSAERTHLRSSRHMSRMQTCFFFQAYSFSFKVLRYNPLIRRSSDVTCSRGRMTLQREFT